MNVLSLFDGMSCGMIALEKAGIKVDNYFASEIDKYAIKVSKENYPEIEHLGNVIDYKNWQLPKIDLLIGGSPCQDLSRVKSKDGKGLDGEKSRLFYTYFHALNRFKPKYFLLENVVMDKEYEDIISALLGVEPVLINSNAFSAQDRPRLYWTNIPFDKGLKECKINIDDIKESVVDEKYYYDLPYDFKGDEKKVIATLHTHKDNGKRIFTDTTSRVYNVKKKSPTLTAVAGGHQEKKIYDNGRVRKLTPLEYERLQTVPVREIEIEVNLCEESARSFVNAVEKSHTVQKNVSIVEETLLKEFAKNAEKNTKQKSQKIKRIVLENVNTETQKKTKECTQNNQKEVYIYADSAEKKMMYKNLKTEEIFAEENVSISITEGKITQFGKVGQLQKDKNYIHQKNGKIVLILSGNEIMQLAEFVLSNSIMESNQNSIYTILDRLSTKNIDAIMTICYLFAKSVIDGFTVNKMQIKSLYLNVKEGYTSIVSNSQRYKMLGNGWTVDVIAHIFKGLKGD